jgi:serine phosphatase RsbU (regulator of sigma subunit)
MEIRFAVSKVNKYASAESGDTVEMVERPRGGLSIVLADGQSSGKGAKSISNQVVRRVISLLAEGVRDGAAARAASDFLFTERSGKVSSTLNILSVDMVTRTLVITRNNPAPVFIGYCDGSIKVLEDTSYPIGIYRDTRPVISEVNLISGLTSLIFTDGITHAGSRSGTKIDIHAFLQKYLNTENLSPQIIADDLINQAIKLDQGRPCDDISLVVLKVTNNEGDSIRRMTVRLPITAQ